MKKSVFLKVVCALLAVLMTSIAFAACNGAKSGTNTQTNATAGGDDAPVPHYDWGGRPLDILGTHNAHEPNFELVGNSDGNIVEQAVFSRNSQIEDYYNVEINDIGTESDKPLTLIQNTIFTGDHLYDLAFLVRNDMSTAIQNGYFTDLTALPYLDFTKKYYNSLSIESMKVGGRLFHMVSDFSLVDKARTNVLFYNRDLGAEYHFDDIIQLVRDGDWTFEEMYKNMKNADLDGNDMRDLSDLWGLVCGGKEGAAAFWSALGNKMVTVNKDGEWSVDVANEHSVNSISKLQKIFTDDNMFFQPGRWKVGDETDWSTAYTTFIGKKAFYQASSLSTIVNLGEDADFSYTVLPFPKYDADQTEYYTTNDNTYCSTFGVPTCAMDPDFSAFMIEVLSWKSHTTTYPAYMETMCKVRSSYDATCAEMMELVLGGLTYDFGLVYTGLGLKTNVLLVSIYEKRDITVLYDGVKESVESAKLPGMIDTIMNLE